MSNDLMANEPNALKYLLDSPIYFIKSDFIDYEKNPDNSIVESNSSNEPTEAQTHRPKYKGGFAKKIIVILSSDSGSSNTEEQELFSKTIAALKLGLEDLALIEIAKTDSALDMIDLLNQLKPEKLITFGEIPGLPIKKLHSLVQFNNVPTLHCSSLKTLSQKQAIKVEWWSAIKQFLT